MPRISFAECWENLNPYEPPYSDPLSEWLEVHREDCDGCSECEPDYNIYEDE